MMTRWICCSLLVLAVVVRGHSVFPTSFRFPNFLNHPKLNLVGDAYTEVNELVVAGPGTRKTGAVWFAQTFDISDGFFTEFTLSISHVENRGGEGIAFVLQRDGEYALGAGVEGLGYEGLGEGVAIEIDGKRDAHQKHSNDATDDGAHVAIRNALKPGERLRADHGADLVVPLPNFAQFNKPIDIRVEYSPSTGDITCEFNVAAKGPPEWMYGAHAKVGMVVGGESFLAGFSASTGHHSSARFAITRWRFGVAASKMQGCVGGFNGPECSVTDEEAKRECPRRETCLGCVRNVYNCVWCGAGKGVKHGGECRVGNADGIETCSSFLAEEAGCSSGLGLVWLWISLGVFVIVFCFGFVLVRTLPRPKAYRAVSLLVALGIGALMGMILSYAVAAALVEISSSPFFALAFALFFFYLGGVVALEVFKMRATNPTWTWDQVASVIAVVWIVLAGILCFVLDKKFVMWLPEAVKVILFAILAAALNFCVVFSAVDLTNELHEKWTRRSTSTPGLAEMLDTETRTRMFASDNRRFFRVAESKARYGLLIMASLVSGLYFGLVFGLMRIEEEQVYRAALMLKQESLYTFPAGALIGGLSGLLLQLLAQNPGQSEGEVERIIQEARDDL